ncbi:putative beta-calactosidase [Talaromyces proteolyticus]|uniref:Beta-galactosidase n=1 Tax=Talaromyces proteolyticus TaxID=1131652 RepID=A0AAD4KNY0_9EURO|nr:putative beta-calactosidase [Talaromyces proteolyticus]KAH8692766.1 putative beta-calactosidase [Talaromyces proteolyticus]
MRVPPLLCLLSGLIQVQLVIGKTNFTYDQKSFYLNGEPFQIIGGQMDAQRVPWQSWPSRFSYARAMGLNTIFTYVYWNLIEDQPGQYITNGSNNIYAYVQQAQEAGLQVVLRVGPYICGERDWGGFPAWLNNVGDMTVRSNNDAFLNQTQSWLSWLGNWLNPLAIGNGGPVIMAQIENEYGFYGSDHTYTGALSSQFNSTFDSSIVFYTNDGPSSALQSGEIPYVLAETDGSVYDMLTARPQYVQASSQGPNLDGEYYIAGTDQWGVNNTHASFSGQPDRIKSIQADLSGALANGSSFSIYMFHGGTNFGFSNGAYWNNDRTNPITTSYDYGAPLDETGRPTDIYYALRDSLKPYAKNITSVPDVLPLVSIPSINVQPSFYLFDGLPDPLQMDQLKNIEQLNQWYGYTLYRHVANSTLSGLLNLNYGPKDRVIVYINGQRKGVLDSIYPRDQQQNITLTLYEGDILDLLNENLGRIHFGSDITSQTKGVFGDITVGNDEISGWNVYTLPLDEMPTPSVDAQSPVAVSNSSTPIIYTGSFDLTTVGDTFLELPQWTKGVIWVNGNNLGRFWTIGPQQSYYLPGVWLQETNNTIQILNLEPTGLEGTVVGVTNRTWASHPDPDAA